MLLDVRIVIIPVENLEGAITWYTRILGFQPVQADAKSATFNGGGYDLQLELDPPRAKRRRGATGNLYWRVHDMDQALQKVLRAGGTVHSPAREIEDIGLVASVADPFGTVISLIEERRRRAL